MYLAAMDAIYPINNNVLFFIEGTGQQGLAYNWGDGLATASSAIAAAGVSDPNAFFTALMGREYLNQVLSSNLFVVECFIRHMHCKIDCSAAATPVWRTGAPVGCHLHLRF